MFSFAGYSATEWNIGELDNWSFSNNPLTLNYTFDHAGFSDPDWTIGNLGNWDVGHVTSVSGMVASTDGFQPPKVYPLAFGSAGLVALLPLSTVCAVICVP